MNTKKSKVTSEYATSSSSQSDADRAILMMNRAAFTKLTFLFRNAHYVAQSNRPYSDYVSLCQLDKAKGTDIGDTYITEKSCQKFVNAIAYDRQKEQDEIL